MDDIDLFLKEDLGDEGDITSSLLFKDEKGFAFIKAKENCILAGAEESSKVFNRLGLMVRHIKKDGEKKT